MNSIVEKIKYARKQQNIKQKEMAKKLNTTQANYSKMERGEQSIKFDFIIQISQILGVDINYFSTDMTYEEALVRCKTELEKPTDKANIFLMLNSLKELFYEKGFKDFQKKLKSKNVKEVLTQMQMYTLLNNKHLQELMNIVMFLQEEDIQRVRDMAIGFVFGTYPKKQEQE
jgi:transcriptional regulator with XRE-family HTH domain